MSAKFQKPKDIIGGGVVVAIGAIFLLLGRDLEFGNSFRMGPGYFPIALSLLMIALGVAMIVPALRAPREEGTFDHIPWRGLILTIGATIFFGLTIRGLGLLPVLAVTVFAVASASRYATIRVSILLAAGLAIGCTLLFVYALGLPLPVLGPWLTHLWATPPAPAQ